jgi:5-methylcytosine-specific restriction endonuclease McrA
MGVRGPSSGFGFWPGTGTGARVRGPRCRGEASVVDHIIPWRAGGPWWGPSNLRAACRSCNTARAYAGFESRRRPSREW